MKIREERPDGREKTKAKRQTSRADRVRGSRASSGARRRTYRYMLLSQKEKEREGVRALAREEKKERRGRELCVLRSAHAFRET